jgi:predicted ATPase/serine/threonine protein kinase
VNAYRWRRLGELFHRASELPEREQVTWLRHACPDDEELRREVAAMLSAHGSRGILDRPAGLTASDLWSEVHELAPGTWVGAYQVRRELDRGGMGVVYEAHDPRLDRLVALKCLPPRLQHDARAKAHFLAEARAAAAIDHPNICTVYELGEAEGRLFIAMALYEGQTLRHLLDAGRLPVTRAVFIAAQVARGLECAHHAGVIHRDIKPSNIIITEPGEAKILDFGVAQFESDALGDGDWAGTPHYMSPEQAAHESTDARADLWALGVVLYEMLTGVRPFEGQGSPAVLRAIAESAPPPVRQLRPDVPARLEPVLARLLAKRAAERFQSATEVLAALTATLEPGSAPASQACRVPVPLTPLIGREDDVASVAALVRTSRLVTLTGTGGTGKTRLALAVADAVADDFAGGVVFVPLGAIRDPSLLASTIAEALDVRPAPGRPMWETVRGALEHRRVLLVLDNLEQIAGAAGDLADLLATCRLTTAVVTSRVALRIDGERRYNVPPLALPASEDAHDPAAVARAPAAALFAERAHTVDPAFVITHENAQAVVDLCRRLEGLPLAIELAAANVALLPPPRMLERLRGPLDVPQRGGRDRVARHRTLRDAIGWSYGLLSPDDQRVFRVLGVFAGSCALDAVQAVSGALFPGVMVEDVLDGLLDHGLAQRHVGPMATIRLSTPASIQAFATERLEAEGEAEPARRAHAAHYLRLAEAAAPMLVGPDQNRWLDQLQADHDNLRAALAWTVGEGDHVQALRLGTELWRFWIARGHLHEGRAHLQALVAGAADAPEPLRLRALNGLATLLQSEGRARAALDVLEEALRVAQRRGLDTASAVLLNNISGVQAELAEYDAAARHGYEALETCRALGDTRGVALALNNLGWVAMYRGEMRQSVDLHARGLELRRAMGDDRGVAFVLANLALAHAWCGQFDEASASVAKSLATLEGLADSVLLAWTECVRATTCWLQEQPDTARTALEASRAAARAGGNPSVLAFAFMCAGHVARAEGDPRSAAEAFAESLRLHQDCSMPWGEAGARCGLGLVALDGGETGRALALLHDAMAVQQRIGARLGAVHSREALALAAFAVGDHTRAAAHWREASEARVALGTPLSPVERRSLGLLLGWRAADAGGNASDAR